MVLCEIIISANQVLGLGFTFILVVVAIIGLILNINKANQRKLDCKLDVSTFKEHERSQDKDYKVLDLQIQDIYKDMEKSEAQLTEVRIFMGAINENLKHINEKLNKIQPT